MIRLRAGKHQRKGRMPGGSSETTRPACRDPPCRPRLRADRRRRPRRGSTATVGPPRRERAFVRGRVDAERHAAHDRNAAGRQVAPERARHLEAVGEARARARRPPPPAPSASASSRPRSPEQVQSAPGASAVCAGARGKAARVPAHGREARRGGPRPRRGRRRTRASRASTSRALVAADAPAIELVVGEREQLGQPARCSPAPRAIQGASSAEQRGAAQAASHALTASAGHRGVERGRMARGRRRPARRVARRDPVASRRGRRACAPPAARGRARAS